MTRQEGSLERLGQVQRDLPQLLTNALDDDEREFRLSLKRGEPAWDRLDLADGASLPDQDRRERVTHVVESGSAAGRPAPGSDGTPGR